MSNYKIYPSLLDKFQDFLDYDQVAESPWNKVGESAHAKGLHLDKQVGDYILSPQEMADKIEVELINSINRCDKEPCEAADAGTCFNEVVDCLINRCTTQRDDMTIASLRRSDGTPYAIMATLNGFTFYYDINLCKDVAKYFDGALCQYLVEGELPTMYGDVHLYGYIDEWLGSKIYDIKTTSMYDFGKFERKYQKLVYPYCAVQSGLAENIEEFEYTVVKWNKNINDVRVVERKYSDGVDNLNDYTAQEEMPIKIWGGTCYTEVYSYNHTLATQKLRQICERFIEWLEYRRDYITDKKIFGGENPSGYKGIKLERL